MEKDKRMIWEDCAQCAHKHLTAAYAALTAMTDDCHELQLHIDAHRVFYARAYILNDEAINGYTGNGSLACGCLAMAELTCLDQDDEKRYRDLRLCLSRVNRRGVRLQSNVSLGEFVAGHIAEALREQESLTESRELAYTFLEGSFHVEDPIAYRAVLARAILDLEDTFCLMGKGGNDHE